MAKVLPAAAIRFCRDCGAQWDPSAGDCETCAVRRPRVDAATARFQLEHRSIYSAVWLYFALLAVSIVMAVSRSIDENISLLRLEAVGAAAMSLIIVGWAIAQRGLLAGAFRLPRIGWLLLAVPIGVVTFIAAEAILFQLNRRLGLPLMDASENFRSLPYGLAIAIGTVCLQPAFFEELGFRGVILPSLRRALTTGEAITVTALMFGILHLSVLSLPHLVALGWMAGWIRCRSGSLYPAMIVHFTHNALVLAADWHGAAHGRTWLW